MANFNSSRSTTTSLTWGLLQVARTTIRSVAVITGVLVLAGVVLGLSGCSRQKSEDHNVKTSQSTQPAAISIPIRKHSLAPVMAKKRRVTTKRPATIAYVSIPYGVSFRFPGQYELTTPGNDGESSLAEQVPNNFVQPGGVTVATIEMPSGTAISFFNVSANKKLTEQQCRQFATPAVWDFAGNLPVDSSDGSIPLPVSLHGVKFTKLENASEQEDVKYYHHFEPAANGVGGTCYEFALGVEQSRVSSQTLDYSAIFDKLESVMATVEIKSEKSGAVRASAAAGR
jgi:hypothetical protein